MVQEVVFNALLPIFGIWQLGVAQWALAQLLLPCINYVQHLLPVRRTSSQEYLELFRFVLQARAPCNMGMTFDALLAPRSSYFLCSMSIVGPHRFYRPRPHNSQTDFRAIRILVRCDLLFETVIGTQTLNKNSKAANEATLERVSRNHWLLARAKRSCLATKRPSARVYPLPQKSTTTGK